MARVMAVTFETHGQLHYLDPGDASYRVGEWVLYPTEFGPEVTQVVWAPEFVDAEGFDDLPRCAGRASEADLARDRTNKQRRAEALAAAKELVARHGLPMKIVGVDWIDRSPDVDLLVAIYYTAPGRVDFRALIGELARTLQARVDLRQVGARDATRITGGIGSCGRDLCCSTFLTDFEPVGMRLVKEQNLAPNPLAIQGQCGKLMCCLKYEHPLYQAFEDEAPAIGSRVESPIGEGTVIGHQVPAQTVSVRNGQGEVARCPLADVCPSSQKRTVRDVEQRELVATAPAAPATGARPAPGVGDRVASAAGPVVAPDAGAPAQAAPERQGFGGVTGSGKVKKPRHRKTRQDDGGAPANGSVENGPAQGSSSGDDSAEKGGE